jgi:hypothetical protein
MGITNSADPNGICFDRRMDTFDLAVCDETSSKNSENNRNCPNLGSRIINYCCNILMTFSSKEKWNESIA